MNGPVSVSCALRYLWDQVNRGLEGFWRSLRPAGPDLSKGWIAVSFFMRRVSDDFEKRKTKNPPVDGNLGRNESVFIYFLFED